MKSNHLKGVSVYLPATDKLVKKEDLPAIQIRKGEGIVLLVDDEDMIMPGMGGGETFDILRQFDPNVKVLLSSGYSIYGRAQEILDRGCHGFIQNPFDIKGLSNKIVEILAKR